METLNRVLGKKPTEPKFSEEARFLEPSVDMKEEAMNLIKRLQHSAVAVSVGHVDGGVLSFLVEKGIVTLDGSYAVARPGIFMCSRCREFVGSKSRAEYSRCLAKGIDLPMAGEDTIRARACPSFWLACLREMA